MRNFNTQLIVLLASISIFGVGCGSSNSDSTATTAAVTSADGSGTIPSAPGGSYTNVGTTATTNKIDFVPTSFEEFSSYVATHPLNNPTDFKLTVALQDVGAGRYGGTVKIGYNDAGQAYEGSFNSGTGINQALTGLQDSGLYEPEYNRWFTINGQKAFSGFFQDQYGAIVVVIDNVVNQGDGQGGGYVTGSVYYQNFAQSPYGVTQSPYRKCWFIRAGPYNCRADEVILKTALYPGGGYRKLGTFSGLMVAAAFK